MAVDPLFLSSGLGYTLADVPVDFGKLMWQEHHPRFLESRARITYTADVRNERIVVPISDRLITEDDTDFVSYIDPGRKKYESDLKQTLGENPAVHQRIPLSGSDGDIKAAERGEAFANALREKQGKFGRIVGKLVEDGEVGITILYDLDDYLAYPLPSDILSAREWAKLPKDEQDDWTEVTHKGRTTYRRYKAKYWRDRDGRAPNDAYYRERDEKDGSRRTFERDRLATRRAWKEHAKAWRAGEVPLLVDIVSATDCVPLLVKGDDEDNPWECRGLVKRKLYSYSDLVKHGYRCHAIEGELYPRGFDAKAGKQGVWLYEVWCWLEDEDGEEVPCVVYTIDGHATDMLDRKHGDYAPAIVNLKDEYGLTTLPANYFYGAHTDADDPDWYAYPACYELLSPILNRENTITSYQIHVRKYAMGNKMATSPNKDVPAASYMNAETNTFEPDLDADIVLLPNPTFPLVMPPAPQAVKDLFGVYDRDLATSANTGPDGGSGASGHALTVGAALDRSKNAHVLDGARRATKWIGETSLEMLGALVEQHHVQISVFPQSETPPDQSSNRKSNAIEFNPRDWKGNYTLRTYYRKIGNLAEIQQEADLKERGLSTFDRVMEKKGVDNPMAERIGVAVDQFWESEQGRTMMLIEALKRRGDMERVKLLEKQASQEVQPGGLPTAALSPEAQMMAQLGPPGQIGPPGAAPMPGMQLPNMAASSLGGITAGALGTAALQNEANTMAGLPVAGVGAGAA